ncbi:dTDP-4-dehydrorhamnose reductase [Luteimonas terricola]|uniref:dTDP-4-dehydrorhamnose reductase n=1 Tax=Luteimonas terricola TaxID=645597 RepID=A0ABQ2EJF7_9GAMM|nr:dTDP-4-dehydrorhamnose reductase [Luteimonas terricola]GGK11295.1 NAD(P)-dependent oxidoreductase [Luteimonas terricola]
MRLLLLGANGQVGHALRSELAFLGDLVCTTRSGVLSDGSACETADFDVPGTLPPLVDRIAPDVVVNAAAYTAVDRAEQERDAAFRANSEAPAALADACARRGALLVHYSTDYVFDGSADRPWREDDPTSPLGAYGASKLAGEAAVRGSGAHHMVFRTAWVYGAHGHNFMRTMLRLGAERDELGVVADQVGTPTPARLIAQATAHALRTDPGASGLWHLTAAGGTTWHGFAEAIFAGARARGLLAKVPRVLPIATSDYPTPARRPAYSRLDTGRLESDFGIALPEWEQALKAVLDEVAAPG